MKEISFQKKILILSVFLLAVVNLYFISVLLDKGPRGEIRNDISIYQDFPELKDLNQNPENLEEVSQFFTDLAQAQGSQYALYALVSAANTGRIPEHIDIHLLGHTVGDLLYKELGLAAIEICTHDLRNACSHSIVIGAFYKDGVGALSDIAEVCRNAPGGSGAYTMCFHGLGHGVLSYTGYILEETIDLCKLTGTEEYHNSEYPECVGGAVMEMMSGIADPVVWKSQKGNYFKEDDPLAPCNMALMPKEVQPLCYSYLTPHLFEFAGGSLADPQPEHFKKAFEYCDQIPQNEQANRRTCFGGLGKEFIVLAADHSLANIENMTKEQLKTVYDWCLLTDDKMGQKDCVGNAMASMYWGGENTPDTAIKFCDSIPNVDIRSYCFDHFFSSVRNYVADKKERADLCRNLIPTDQLTKCEEEVLGGVF